MCMELEGEQNTKWGQETLPIWLFLPQDTRNKLSPYSSAEADITFYLYSITLIHWKLFSCTFCLDDQIKKTKKLHFRRIAQSNIPSVKWQKFSVPQRNEVFLTRGNQGALFHLTWPAMLKSSSVISSSLLYCISCGSPSKSAPRMGHHMVDFSWDVKLIHCTCYMASSGSWNC